MPGPTFQSGERVSLHTVAEDDLDMFARARSHPSLRVPSAISGPSNRDGLETFYEEEISSEDTYWFVAVTESATVGAAMFTDIETDSGSAGFDWWVLPEFADERYDREMVSLLLTYGFDELRFHRAYTDCLETDERAHEFLESVGFEREGRFREAAFQDGGHVDLLRYGILAAEWGEA